MKLYGMCSSRSTLTMQHSMVCAAAAAFKLLDGWRFTSFLYTCGASRMLGSDVQLCELDGV